MLNDQVFIRINNTNELHDILCSPKGELPIYIEEIKKDFEIQLFQQVSGSHIFQLIHTKDNELLFYHSSPGTKTRVASLHLPNNQVILQNINLVITWSPQNIALYFKNSKWMSHADGKKSFIHFQTDDKGNIIQIGDKGIEVKGLRIISNNQLVISSSAINTWEETLETIKTLKSGKSELGYPYEVSIANVSLITLVSGFETYLKKRFIEIPDEGYKFNKQELIKYLTKRKNFNINDLHELTLKQLIDKTDPNFQNWDISKNLYNKAYGIKFGEINSSSLIEEIKKCLNFRHRLIHVSLNIEIVNELNVPPEEPIFSTNYLSFALKNFDEFIQKLHNKTLYLEN